MVKSRFRLNRLITVIRTRKFYVTSKVSLNMKSRYQRLIIIIAPQLNNIFLNFTFKPCKGLNDSENRMRFIYLHSSARDETS